MGILQSGGNSLLVGQLLVDGSLTGMASREDPHINLESGGEGAEQFYTDGQANEGCHAAVGDGGGKLNLIQKDIEIRQNRVVM